MKELAIVMLIAGLIPALDCYPAAVGPTSATQSIVITPDNVESLATFIDSSATIDSRTIKFAAGSAAHGKLLEVPLGFIAPHATIRITTGLQPPPDGTDHDLGVGLSDGTVANEFWIVDTNNYATLAACLPRFATHDDNRVVERDSNPAQAVMMFKPIEKYGACYLALDSGYINTGTFRAQLDLQSGLSLILRRNDAKEKYTIYYLIVDIFQ